MVHSIVKPFMATPTVECLWHSDSAAWVTVMLPWWILVTRLWRISVMVIPRLFSGNWTFGSCVLVLSALATFRPPLRRAFSNLTYWLKKPDYKLCGVRNHITVNFKKLPLGKFSFSNMHCWVFIRFPLGMANLLATLGTRKITSDWDGVSEK